MSEFPSLISEPIIWKQHTNGAFYTIFLAQNKCCVCVCNFLGGRGRGTFGSRYILHRPKQNMYYCTTNANQQLRISATWYYQKKPSETRQTGRYSKCLAQ